LAGRPGSAAARRTIAAMRCLRWGRPWGRLPAPKVEHA
jgi:hypothetical protein